MQESASEARPTRPPYVIRFGPFELNSRAGELRKHGVRIRLQEKPFQILHMLVEHPGEAVLRDEIRLRLWPNNTIVEFDHSINAAIKRLRDALGESAEEPRYVETLARRGYRFIGQLEPAGDPALQEDDAAAAANAASEAKPALPAEEPADLIGRTVCHYRVLELLGSGGMGVVYRAEDLRLGRAVALKFLSEELAADPTAVDRFEREARTASALSHPNICSIFGVDVYQDRPFIAMELVKGESLAAHLRKGPLPLDKVLTLAVPIADALAAAHAKGVIHRDLKPDNVMVTKSSIKLLDFGIARILEPGKASSEQRELTQAGVVPGTLHFASPEQLEGKPADARSDIFAFGLLLYQMLTGRRAFDGDSPAAVIGAILHAQPALDGIPEPLRRIVSACLAKDPDARWQSARDLKLQLEWAAASDVATDASPRKHVSRRMLLAVGACVLLILSLIGLFFRLRPRPEGPLYHVMISTPRLDVSSGSRIALSRDGRRIAFITVDESGARHLAVRSLDSDVVQTIASATDARNDPFWSPDGRSIGYFTTDSLKTVDLASGQVRTLARTAPTPLGGSWGANNQVLFVALGVPKPLATIHAVSAFGGEPKQVTFPRGNEGHMYPHFLSDGKRFLFSVSTGVSGQMELRLGSMDSSETRSLGTIAGNAVPAGPGVLLFRRAEALFAQRVNSRSLSFVGDPVPLMDRIRYYAINGLGAFSASETGVLVFRRGGNTQTHLRWFDRAGKPLGDIGPPGPYWSFDLSRDETKLAATKDDPVLGIGQIWTGDADRAALTRLTANSDFEPHAAWSPDGRRLAYARHRNARSSLMIRDWDGVERERITLNDPGEWTCSISWTPDGRFLAVGAADYTHGKLRILLVASDGTSPPTELINTAGFNPMPQFSPDGRWIAYVSSEESNSPEVYIRPFPDVNRGKWLVSADGGVQPRWRADSREMFYLDRTNHVMAVPIQAAGRVLQAGKPVPLFQTNVPWSPAGRYEYTVSADGQRILACVLAEEDDRRIEMLIGWDSLLK